MADFDKYMSPMGEEKLMEACAAIKHVALDMDGTIYMGSTLFPFTIPFLKSLTDNGIGYSFLTNNPTKSRADYLKRLESLGIIVVAFVGMFILISMWQAPRDGYERASKIQYNDEK